MHGASNFTAAGPSRKPVIVLGAGAFLGMEAARMAALHVRELAGNWGQKESAVAPCLAAAHLLAEYLETALP